MIGKNIEKYCKDFTKIENYEKATVDDKLWHCHHRLETHFSDGTPRPKNDQLSKEELKALNMYYNRPADELIFMLNEEHHSLHRDGNHQEFYRPNEDKWFGITQIKILQKVYLGKINELTTPLEKDFYEYIKVKQQQEKLYKDIISKYYDEKEATDEVNLVNGNTRFDKFTLISQNSFI